MLWPKLDSVCLVVYIERAFLNFLKQKPLLNEIEKMKGVKLIPCNLAHLQLAEKAQSLSSGEFNQFLFIYDYSPRIFLEQC